MEESHADNTQASLQTLPLELRWKIFEFLDYPSALFLKATCHLFRSTPKNPLFFQSIGDRETFLRTAEKFPQHNEGYACFLCHVIKSRNHFSMKQITKKRDKGNVQSFSRFCIDCGLRKGIYSGGQQIEKADGLLFWKCGSCPTLTRRICFAYMKCSDCLNVTAEFDGIVCPACRQSWQSCHVGCPRLVQDSQVHGHE